MKASDVKVCPCNWHAKEIEFRKSGFKELVDLDPSGSVRLVFPDGTELIFETTEWGWVYIKEASSNESI